jgi:ketosteroid isomerase-like protein
VPLAPVAPPVVAPPPAAPDPVAQACTKVPEVVQTWLGAWNSKNFSGYLQNYADNFTPAMGMSRSAWEALRKKRIGKQGDIKTSISDITPVACDATTAEVSFKQEYGSVDYRDSVEKTLSLVRSGNVWKIVKETVTKGRTF